MFDPLSYMISKLNHITDHILDYPRWLKRSLVILSDAVICILSILLAFSLRMGEWILWNEGIAKLIFGAFAIWLPIFTAMNVYQTIFRYAGSGTIKTLLKASTMVMLVFMTVFMLIGFDYVPRTMGVLFPVIFFLALSLSRIVARYILYDLVGSNAFEGHKRRVFIYGAGSAGRQLALSIRHEPSMALLAYVDDDQSLEAETLDGTKIFHANNIGQYIEKYKPTDVLIALPSASRFRRAEIVQSLQKYDLHVQTLPQAREIVTGKVSIGDLREVQIGDLLGRDPVPPVAGLIDKTIAGKTVLVSGAGGSIGSELCWQIAKAAPAKLILAEMTEHALYTIEADLRSQMAKGQFNDNFEIIPSLINLANKGAVDDMIARYKPDTIFHAAAYKHVPLVEENIIAGLSNNIYSALYTAMAAKAHNVSHYILVSTDKAVRPTNVMGASKRVCEQILQAISDKQADNQSDNQTDKDTIFAIVRFGNVLGSSGSVVPLFQRQINTGGPVTLTHKDITRYFMTIKEAALLVVQAGAMAKGGEVFVLDMGQSVRIYDMAVSMIKLSGLTLKDADNPNGDIEITEVGLRPAEKLYEELLIGNSPEPTEHQRIMRASETFIAWDELTQKLTEMQHALENYDQEAAIAILRILVPEYAPESSEARQGNIDENNQPIAI